MLIHTDVGGRKTTMHEYEDTEELMVIISHEGINELWTVRFGTIEKEVRRN